MNTNPANNEGSNLREVSTPPRRRLALYSHDGFGLGHFRRCLLLAQRVQEHLSNVEILLLTGSPKANFFQLPENTRLVILEPVTKNSQGDYTPRNPQLDLLHALERRRDKLRKELLLFDPDLLVVDHVPTGLCGELVPLLADLKSRGTKVAIGLRDIIDESHTVQSSWKNSGSNLLVESLYDHVWVYGNREIFDLGELYNLSPSTRRRVDYLGYLRRIQSNPLEQDLLNSLPRRMAYQKKIVCVAGGGEDGTPLGTTFLETLSKTTGNYIGTLITGPHLDRTVARSLITRFQDCRNIEILRFTTHLEDHLRSADVIVSMGGYNATLEAIAVRKPTIIVPRVNPRKEQWLRASKFSQLNLLKVIHPEDLSTDNLQEAIQESLEIHEPPSAEDAGLCMDGIGNFLSRVEDILVQQKSRIRKEDHDVEDKLLRA